jgi:hypothetical protein
MANIIVNANGTISDSFSIGKSGKGIVIYQGDTIPSNLLGNTGDVFIKRTTEPLILKKKSSGWVNISNKEVITVASTTTISPTQSSTLYLADSSSSSLTLTLSTSSLEVGKEVIIKDSTGSSSINSITVNTEGSETIDGQASFTISSNYTSISIISDGSNWFII